MEISEKKKKEMLWTMILSRKFSDARVDLCKIEGKIPGMMILSTGQETLGSGVCAALEPNDVIITNHRSHTHLLAKGAEPREIKAWAAHCPGLKVVMPATSADAKGLLKSSIRDDNPVIFIEHMGLYFAQMPVPEDDYLTPLGKAEIKRSGKDLTVVTWSGMLGVALKAAEILSRDGIETEIVDLRALTPLDRETVLASVEKTGRLIVLHEATRTGGFAGEIAAVVMEEGFSSLKAPLRRVTGPDIPVPASPPLEKFYIPDETDLIRAAREIL